MASCTSTGHEVEEFMKGPLVAWVSSCSKFVDDNPKEPLTYEILVDGVLIHRIFRRMNIPTVDDVSLFINVSTKIGHHHDDDDNNDQEEDIIDLRAQNLVKVMRNIRNYLELEIKYILLRQPDVVRLAKDPRGNVNELELLLHLLLGCAVECPENDFYVERIRCLDVVSQEGIMEYIKKFKYMPYIALSSEMLSLDLNHQTNVQLTLSHLRRLRMERDRYRHLGITRVNANSTILPDSDCLLDIDDDYELFDGDDQDVQETLEYSSRLEFEDDERKYRSDKRKLEELTKSQRKEINELRDNLTEDAEKLNDAQHELSICSGKVKRLEKQLLEATIHQADVAQLEVKASRVDLLDDIIKNYQEKLANQQSMEERLVELTRKNEELQEYQDSASKEIKMLIKSMNELDEQVADLEAKNEELVGEKEECLRREQEYISLNARLEFQVKELKSKMLERIIEPDETLMNNSLSSSQDTWDTETDFESIHSGNYEEIGIEANERTIMIDDNNNNNKSLADELKQEADYHAKKVLLHQLEVYKQKITELELKLNKNVESDPPNSLHKSELNVSLDLRYFREKSDLKCQPRKRNHVTTTWFRVNDDKPESVVINVQPSVRDEIEQAIEARASSFDWSHLDLDLDEHSALIKLLEELVPIDCESCSYEIESKRSALADKIGELLLKLDYHERRKKWKSYDFRRPIMKFFRTICSLGGRRRRPTIDKASNAKKLNIVRQLLKSDFSSVASVNTEYANGQLLGESGSESSSGISEGFHSGSYRRFWQPDSSCELMYQDGCKDRSSAKIVGRSFYV